MPLLERVIWYQTCLDLVKNLIDKVVDVDLVIVGEWSWILKFGR